MKHTKHAVAAAALVGTLALVGCSTPSAGADAAAADCTPSDGPVTLEFTSWIPGMEDVVKTWNEENPDIQVEVQTGPNGNSGTYQNFFNQLEAGNAPDLGQIEYDALPNFRVQDGLEDLAACADVVAAEDEFVDWTWGQVTLGTDDEVYGIPQDQGPMALFFRSDLFEANGIPVPTTWEEYKHAAEQIRALGGYITNFSQSDINQFAGLVWQAGGQWFANDGDEWTVELTGEESQQVAEYWQDLIDNDLVSTVPAWTDEWNNAYNSGQVAVFKGTEHLYEAAKFALWLNTADEALTALNESANIYPATKSGLELPALQDGVEFYGGQAIYDVFADAASQVSPDFPWGPTMTQTYTDVSDGFKAAASGQGTLLEALEQGQQSTIDALEAQSIPVKE